MLQGLPGRTAGVLDRSLREGLKVEDAGVAPPAGFLLLNVQKRSRLDESFIVDLPLERLPGRLHRPDGLHAAAVAGRQLVPEAPARRHAVIPWHAMEPEQVVVRHAIQAAVE